MLARRRGEVAPGAPSALTAPAGRARGDPAGGGHPDRGQRRCPRRRDLGRRGAGAGRRPRGTAGQALRRRPGGAERPNGRTPNTFLTPAGCLLTRSFGRCRILGMPTFLCNAIGGPDAKRTADPLSAGSAGQRVAHWGAPFACGRLDADRTIDSATPKAWASPHRWARAPTGWRPHRKVGWSRSR